MSNTRLDIANLGLDALGRIVLSDDQLEGFEDAADIVSAGANTSCVGTTNSSCSNGSCSNSSNVNCTNHVVCAFSTNHNGACARVLEVEG